VSRVKDDPFFLLRVPRADIGYALIVTNPVPAIAPEGRQSHFERLYPSGILKVASPLRAQGSPSGGLGEALTSRRTAAICCRLARYSLTSARSCRIECVPFCRTLPFAPALALPSGVRGPVANRQGSLTSAAADSRARPSGVSPCLLR
jgi:hypothetical protein